MMCVHVCVFNREIVRSNFVWMVGEGPEAAKRRWNSSRYRVVEITTNA